MLKSIMLILCTIHIYNYQTKRKEERNLLHRHIYYESLQVCALNTIIFVFFPIVFVKLRTTCNNKLLQRKMQLSLQLDAVMNYYTTVLFI